MGARGLHQPSGHRSLGAGAERTVRRSGPSCA